MEGIFGFRYEEDFQGYYKKSRRFQECYDLSIRKIISFVFHWRENVQISVSRRLLVRFQSTEKATISVRGFQILNRSKGIGPAFQTASNLFRHINIYWLKYFRIRIQVWKVESGSGTLINTLGALTGRRGVPGRDLSGVKI